MVKRLYIHIGRAKTGTSAIQRFLAMNGPALMSHGYKYADTGLFYATHHPLAWSLHKKAYEMGTGRYWRHASRYARLDRSPEEYWMALRQEIEDCFLPFYIISSEEFGVVLDLHVITQLLVEYLSDLEVKFIVYIRRQDQFLQSVYNQAVKGEEDRFTGDFWSYVQPILNEGGADYLKLLSIIADVFGDSNIIVRVYEKEQLRENIFVDFLDAIGISNYAEFQFPQNVYNPGLSNRALLIARALNRVPVSADVRTHLMNRLQSLCVTQQPFLEHDFLSPRERVELLRRFDRSNEIVARRFLGRADGRLFHAPEPYPETQWDDKLSTADALGLLELMAELWIYYLTLVGPETTVNHLRDQMITVIRQNFLSGTRPVYIWGAGGGGQKTLEMLRVEGIQVAGFVDGDSSKWGSELAGLTVKSPLMLKNDSCPKPYVVIGSMYFKEIEDQLLAWGYRKSQDYWINTLL